MIVLVYVIRSIVGPGFVAVIQGQIYARIRLLSNWPKSNKKLCSLDEATVVQNIAWPKKRHSYQLPFVNGIS